MTLVEKLKNRFIGKAAIAVVLLLLPVVLNLFGYDYGVLICCFAALYIIAVSGLDILFGYCGQISMGQAAFFAIGAYGSVIMHKYLSIPVFFSMILSSILATIIGCIIAYPASKLVFHFLSLATVAFGEIVYQFVSQSPKGITGNFTGFFTEYLSFFGFKLNSNIRFYYYALIMVVIFLLLKTNLIKSRTGRALIAIRENGHAADGMGVNVRKYKVLAFSISAFYTAYAGGMYAHLVRFISPDTYTNKQSVMFLTMLLFGGTASLGGTVSGVFTVLILNEILRSAGRYQLFAYGILLLLVIMLFPGGFYRFTKDLILKWKGGKRNAKG